MVPCASPCALFHYIHTQSRRARTVSLFLACARFSESFPRVFPRFCLSKIPSARIKCSAKIKWTATLCLHVAIDRGRTRSNSCGDRRFQTTDRFSGIHNCFCVCALLLRWLLLTELTFCTSSRRSFISRFWTFFREPGGDLKFRNAPVNLLFFSATLIGYCTCSR